MTFILLFAMFFTTLFATCTATSPMYLRNQTTLVRMDGATVTWEQAWSVPTYKNVGPLAETLDVVVGNGVSALVCFNATSGEKISEYVPSVNFTNDLFKAPAVWGYMAILNAVDYSTHAVNLLTGEQIWRVELGKAPFQISIDADVVVCSIGVNMVGLNRTTGEQLWYKSSTPLVFSMQEGSVSMVQYGNTKFEAISGVVSHFESTNNQCDLAQVKVPGFVWCTAKTPTSVMAYDTETMAVKWVKVVDSIREPNPLYKIRASKDAYYLVLYRSKLHVYNQTTGVSWTYDDGIAYDSLEVIGQLAFLCLIVPNVEGDLFLTVTCVDLTTTNGAVLWSKRYDNTPFRNTYGTFRTSTYSTSNILVVRSIIGETMILDLNGEVVRSATQNDRYYVSVGLPTSVTAPSHPTMSTSASPTNSPTSSSTAPTPSPTSSSTAPTPSPTSSSTAPTPSPTSSSTAPTPSRTSSSTAPTPSPTSSSTAPTPNPISFSTISPTTSPTTQTSRPTPRVRRMPPHLDDRFHLAAATSQRPSLLLLFVVCLGLLV